MHRSSLRVRALVVSVLALSMLVACGDDGDDSGATTLEIPANTADMAKNYSEIVHASYTDALTSAQTLASSIDTFIAAPNQANLDAARQAWYASREPYLQTEVYRFYDGPIDNPDDGPEGLINAWPLDENYIDYTAEEPSAGAVNDAGKTIDGPTLEGLNEVGGEKNIATGYHAIEFLLWGQDMDPAGPGARPFTDFATDGTGTAANQDRRGLYLDVSSDLLVTHLQGLVDAWAPGNASNYRAEFEAADPKESLRRVLTGMIVLSGFETGGERLQAALDSGDQEDEHSCFSDNTHRDMVQDVVGVQNVWNGSYTKLDGSTVSGVGVKAVIEAADPDLAAKLDAEIAESVRLANALQPPFDQEIATTNTEGRARVQALIVALRAQEGTMEEIFLAFGLTVPQPE